MDEQAKWYVVHTFSGYENKVATNLEKIVENRHLQDWIHEVRIPTETVSEVKDGVRRDVERKIFPGYVLVKMIMNDETWYIVRNTRGVTGFVGPGSHPVPLKENEIEFMLNRATVSVDIAVGEDVRVLSGPLVDHVGKVTDIDTISQKIFVTVSMFGRDVPVELEYDQVVRV